jgi:hypothetical protein
MKVKILLLIICIAFLSISCAPGQGDFNRENKAGFFAGIWHGWIAPITLVISIFDNKIHIYEKNNDGFWYEFGFYIAIISGFGTVAFLRRKR